MSTPNHPLGIFQVRTWNIAGLVRKQTISSPLGSPLAGLNALHNVCGGAWRCVWSRTKGRENQTWRHPCLI
jgi:hypothetical protein